MAPSHRVRPCRICKKYPLSKFELESTSNLGNIKVIKLPRELIDIIHQYYTNKCVCASEQDSCTIL